jgi:tetratricopeptide (TPR) repeat protein
MDFRRYLIVLAVFLVAALVVQPALSAGNQTTNDVTSVISNHTAANVTKIVANQTADLEKDVANQDYNHGVQSITVNDYSGAISFFDKALAENTTMLKKTDALLYLYQGKSFAQIKLEKYPDAVKTADAGLSIYPTDAMLWNNKGWALQNLKKDQDALAAYNKAVSLDGNYTNALLNQGNLLNTMGKYPEAAAAFTRANETDPFNIAAADGLDAAKKGEAGSSQTMTIILIIGLVVVAGFVVWYIKIRKPAEPAPEEKKKKSKKKE